MFGKSCPQKSQSQYKANASSHLIYTVSLPWENWKIFEDMVGEHQVTVIAIYLLPDIAIVAISQSLSHFWQQCLISKLGTGHPYDRH